MAVSYKVFIFTQENKLKQMSKKLNKVVNLFKKSGDNESEKIMLDNLDWAKLTYDGNHDVVVENEHGTQFELDELTETELDIFIFALQNF